MEAYETGVLTTKQKVEFMKWLDEEIGTDYDVEEFEVNKWVLLIFDMTPREVKKVREFENSVYLKIKR